MAARMGDHVRAYPSMPVFPTFALGRRISQSSCGHECSDSTMRLPSDVLAFGCSDPGMIAAIKEAVTIPVMAKARIGHFVEAQVLEALDVDYIDESEVSRPLRPILHSILVMCCSVLCSKHGVVRGGEERGCSAA